MIASFADRKKAISYLSFIERKVTGSTKEEVSKEKYEAMSNEELNRLEWDAYEPFQNWEKTKILVPKEEFEIQKFIDQNKKQ